MTLNGVIALILRYFTEFDRLRHISWRGSVQNILFQLYCGQNWPTQQSHGLFAIAKLLVYGSADNRRRRHVVFRSSVPCPSVNTYLAWRGISIWKSISLKPITNVNGIAEKVIKVKDQRSRSWQNQLIITAEACIRISIIAWHYSVELF